MDNVLCHICNEVFDDRMVFHKHLRSHKVTQAAYYQKYVPRFDLWDKKIILFNSYEYYFSHVFNTRENMYKWLASIDPQRACDWVREQFAERKARKGLIYAPTQAELRTLMLPGIFFINQYFVDYNRFCSELGFLLRYEGINLNAERKFDKSHRIIQDSREQRPLAFSIPSVIQKIDFGDYKLNDDEFSHHCYIERKGLSDFYSTMSNGLKRFRGELHRAQDNKANLIIVIEDTIQHVMEFKSQHSFCKVSSEYVFYNMRKCINDFSNIQFLFVRGREESVRVIEKIFCSDGKFKNVDLQYLYDIGEL